MYFFVDYIQRHLLPVISVYFFSLPYTWGERDQKRLKNNGFSVSLSIIKLVAGCWGQQEPSFCVWLFGTLINLSRWESNPLHAVVLPVPVGCDEIS